MKSKRKGKDGSVKSNMIQSGRVGHLKWTLRIMVLERLRKLKNLGPNKVSDLLVKKKKGPINKMMKMMRKDNS